MPDEDTLVEHVELSSWAEIWVDVEELDQKFGERRKKRKLKDLLARMKEKGAIVVDRISGEVLTVEELKAKAESAEKKGKVLEVRTVPPVSGG